MFENMLGNQFDKNEFLMGCFECLNRLVRMRTLCYSKIITGHISSQTISNVGGFFVWFFLFHVVSESWSAFLYDPLLIRLLGESCYVFVSLV